MRTLLIPGTLILALLGACEEQTGSVSVNAQPQGEVPPSDEVDEDALRRPGTGDYYGAIAGAKRTAERTKDKIDDYQRQVEEQADDVFND